MNKLLSILAVVCIMTCATSCKSSEANYRVAYEKAKANMIERDGVDAETYARIVAEKKSNTAVVAGDSLRLITDRVNIVDDEPATMKPYGVVVGEYKQLFNARSFRDRLKKEGLPAYVVMNGERMYFVVAHGFDTSVDAAVFLKDVRSKIKMKIPIEKPWILARP